MSKIKILKSGVQKTSRGFTLIELLVVIAVLGVLSAIVLVAINPMKRLQAARDTGRVAFVKQVKNATTAYYTAKGQYPGCEPSGCNYPYGGGSGYYYGSLTGSDIFSTRLKNDGFLKTLPSYPAPPADQKNGECNSTVFSAANNNPTYQGSYYLWMCFESWDTTKYNKIQYQNFAYCGPSCNYYAGCGNCKYYCYYNTTWYKYPYCLIGYYKYAPYPTWYGDFEVPPINP